MCARTSGISASLILHFGATVKPKQPRRRAVAYFRRGRSITRTVEPGQPVVRLRFENWSDAPTQLGVLEISQGCGIE